MSDERYLQFPLCLLRNLFADKLKTINDIIEFGLYRYAKKQDYDLFEVARQMMYCFYRKQGDLTNDLRRMIQRYIDSENIQIDDDYNGFSGSEFNPETEIGNIMELFNTDNNFMEKAIEFYQIRQACSRDLLNITCNFDYVLKHGKEIEKTIPEGEPYPSINKSLFFDFRDHEKTEFDMMQFACYIAIRSILGEKPYCRTNKEMILCRAFGYKSNKELPATMNPVIKELFDKYNKRYHIDRILQSLELNWNILIYSHNIRGLYIGLSKKITLESMIVQAETKKKKKQIDALKKRKDEAREKALQQLNKEQQLK